MQQHADFVCWMINPYVACRGIDGWRNYKQQMCCSASPDQTRGRPSDRDIRSLYDYEFVSRTLIFKGVGGGNDEVCCHGRQHPFVRGWKGPHLVHI